MKFLIFLSLSITLALGCSNLPELGICESPDVGHDCSCQAGLACRLTKMYVIRGETYSIRQCLKEDKVIEVETVNMDAGKESAMDRMKRFIPGLRGCRSEADCGGNSCCVRFINKCLPKLPELAECGTGIIHGCGCQDGLDCKPNGFITVPIIGIKIPLLQCVSGLGGGGGGGGGEGGLPPPGGM